jgi:hypothetical protein
MPGLHRKFQSRLGLIAHIKLYEFAEEFRKVSHLASWFEPTRLKLTVVLLTKLSIGICGPQAMHPHDRITYSRLDNVDQSLA